MIHGKGNKGNLNLLVKWVKKGLPWPLAAFENKRSFASMGNVDYIVKELLNKDVDSGIYPVCDDEAISTNELIQIICGCLGKKARLWRIPRGIIRATARLGDMLHLPLNNERLGKLSENYVVNNADLKKAFQIVKLPIFANEGLIFTIQEIIKESR